MSLRLIHLALAACLAPAALLLLAGAPAGAAPPAVQHVTVITTGLTAGQTYYTEFTLTDAKGIGDGNSTAAVSNLVFTNGSLGAVLSPTYGNVTGALGTTLTLRDGPVASGPLADYAQAFTVSGLTSQFSFDLLLSAASVDAGPTPDNFTFQILDSGINNPPLATSGPTGVEFVTADYTSTAPTAFGYHSTGLPTPVGATISAPSSVPEPAPAFTLAFFGLGLGGLILRARRRALPAA